MTARLSAKKQPNGVAGVAGVAPATTTDVGGVSSAVSAAFPIHSPSEYHCTVNFSTFVARV